MSVAICVGACARDYAPCTGREVSYEGAVLDKIERNGYDDSDFDAIVWDAAEGRVRVVNYASTRGWTYHNGATVDATPETLEAAREWMRGWWVRLLTAEAEREARKPEIGRTVRSTTTRGKNKGVEGVVAWAGVNQYRTDRWVTIRRFGFDTPDGRRVFMDEDKIELINPEPVDAEEIERIARSRETQFRAIAYPPVGLLR